MDFCGYPWGAIYSKIHLSYVSNIDDSDILYVDHMYSVLYLTLRLESNRS